MDASQLPPAGGLGLGTKLSLLILGLVAVIVGGLATTMTISTSRQLERQQERTLALSASNVNDLIDVFRADLLRAALRSERTLEGFYPNGLSIDPSATIMVAGTPTPTVRHGDHVLNLDSSIPDVFTQKSGVAATIFARTGDDFVRVSTSLRKENGERALGTMLGPKHPGYAALMSGQAYTGIATLFGRKYASHYEPIRDSSGKVIGIYYVGVDFTEELKKLQQKVGSLRIGESGSFFVLDAQPGTGLGDLLVDATRAGHNVLSERDADGRAIYRELIDGKSGIVRYRASSDRGPREQIAAYRFDPSWSWVIVARIDVDEITAEATRMTRLYAAITALALLVLAGIVYTAIRNLVSRPLAAACATAQQLAAGDLTGRIESDRSDEIGRLLAAMNGISDGLTGVIRDVSINTAQVVTATDDIAQGNQDLAARTERQTIALLRTANTIEQLAGAVRESVDHASHADGVATDAASRAERGNDAMRRLLETMRLIERSASRVADITSVMDGIAFQTNILALNASVEAARAGTQGRGFAVVASEVRNLAQQSAAASRDIKALIDTSVANIGLGTQQVTEAHTAIGDVVGSVNEMTRAVRSIRDAMNEQSASIDTVNGEIGEIKSVTRENAGLVEKASASASGLHERAVHLAESVDAFKVAEAA